MAPSLPLIRVYKAHSELIDSVVTDLLEIFQLFWDATRISLKHTLRLVRRVVRSEWTVLLHIGCTCPIRTLYVRMDKRQNSSYKVSISWLLLSVYILAAAAGVQVKKATSDPLWLLRVLFRCLVFVITNPIKVGIEHVRVNARGCKVITSIL